MIIRIVFTLIIFILFGCASESNKELLYYNTGELMLERFTSNDTVYNIEYYKNGNKKTTKISSNSSTVLKKYNQTNLDYQVTRVNDSIKVVIDYDEAGFKIDSLVKGELNINIISDNDIYSIGDTARIKFNLIDRNYEYQSINLVDDFEANNLFSFDTYGSRNNEINLQFLCDQKGKIILRIVYYDTSIKLTEQLGDSAFYGYRYGVFDFFEYSYVVK